MNDDCQAATHWFPPKHQQRYKKEGTLHVVLNVFKLLKTECKCDAFISTHFSFFFFTRPTCVSKTVSRESDREARSCPEYINHSVVSSWFALWVTRKTSCGMANTSTLRWCRKQEARLAKMAREDRRSLLINRLGGPPASFRSPPPFSFCCFNCCFMTPTDVYERFPNFGSFWWITVSG